MNQAGLGCGAPGVRPREGLQPPSGFLHRAHRIPRGSPLRPVQLALQLPRPHGRHPALPDRALAGLGFRAEAIEYDHHDHEAQKKILIDAFAGHTEWKIPQLLDAVRADPEFYFDSVSQIHMPAWHHGRVALVGDAGYCATLMSGRGTSLALTGAYFLAEELDRAGGDHTTAFARYAARQRPYVEFAQASVGESSANTPPATWEEIHARNARLEATHPV